MCKTSTRKTGDLSQIQEPSLPPRYARRHRAVRVVEIIFITLITLRERLKNLLRPGFWFLIAWTKSRPSLSTLSLFNETASDLSWGVIVGNLNSAAR
jgi:hypothetical protein